MASFEVLDDNLVEAFRTNELDFDSCLFLEPHHRLVRQWDVVGNDPTYEVRLGDAISRFGTVSIWDFEKFSEAAEEAGYHVVFMDDPSPVFEWRESLYVSPPVAVPDLLGGRLDRNGEPLVTINGFLPFQAQGINFLNSCDRACYGQWSTGPQPLHAKILTPAGWTTMGEITLDEEVIGSDGRAHRVTGIYPQGDQEVWRLTFRDGSVVESTYDHLWGFGSSNQTYIVRPLRYFVESGLRWTYREKADAKWYLDRVSPVEFPEIGLPLDPYLLGALLGDGSFTSTVPQLFSHEGEIIPLIEDLIPAGCKISQYGPKHFAIVNKVAGTKPNPVNAAIRSLGLMGHTARTKFIPEEYKRGSISQRLAVLQGLLDTDGSAEKQSARLFTISTQLADDIVEVARSLGGRATKYPRIGQRGPIKGIQYDRADGWNVNVTLPVQFEYFRLARKYVPVRPTVRRNALISVEKVGTFPAQCISVNSPDHRYVTNDYVLTHNTGKTLLAEGAIMLKRQEGFDLTLYVNKPGNLFNAQRKLIDHTDLESVVLLGTPTRRDTIFEGIDDGISAGNQPIMILNAEKFREDKAGLKELVEGRKVLVIFDEMPTKYGNRATALYRATAEVLYTSYSVPHQGHMKGKKVFYPKVGYDRPEDVFYLALSATSLRNSPDDIFNCVRMMDSRIFGSISDFNNLCVAGRDDWGNVVRWKNLDLMGATYSHIVHLADKYRQPEIAAQFPLILPPETIWCDLAAPIEKLYGILQNEYRNIGATSILSIDEILAAIGVLQLLVDNPRAVLASAIKYENYLKARDEFLQTKPNAKELRAWDKRNKSGSRVALKLRTLVNDDSKFTDKDKSGNCIVTKMNQTRELIEGHDDKVVVFSDKNETLLPYMQEWFDLWGITYVTYHGQLSAKRRSEAEHNFRQNPDIKVFLSNDAGQDSIDLPEASLTINYNDPWTNATKVQRVNRQHRIDSIKEAVREATLRTPFTVEERRAQIVATKKSYQDQVDGQIVEQAEAMSKQDFLFILTGEG